MANMVRGKIERPKKKKKEKKKGSFFDEGKKVKKSILGNKQLKEEALNWK